MELLRQGAAFDYRYLGLATEDCLKIRMRENRTSGSVRGSRQILHSRNIVKGVSRLSTRLRAMQFRPFVYDTANQQVPVVIEPMTPQDAATQQRNRSGRRIGPVSISQKANLMSMG